ncbi:MAG: UDP-glucose 4-epimerase GalE [Candidatus Absconditabacteria bacterium]|nr:UDP-glucose 4-epimerase GalE [Candidatus Absconditabacteria bacterium]MDD3868346.1 UDP-glucose 4-epimerase GalE [Candidatus Absconditabacteria bacterium]MDD4714421.1 UDP-glucose 4-epimerase GalE [Candidatus Absconditabacteria bacterium]
METQKKILLTGGLGYIGSHTATVFADAGYDLIIIDNLSNSHEDTLEVLKKLCPSKIKFYDADLRNYEDIEKIFEKHALEIGFVLHFAAKKSVGESCQDPFLYYDHNINGSINLLQAMEKTGVKNIIFSSSATVYDSENILPPFTEGDRTRTINPYGTTKLMIEQLLRDMVMHKGFNAIALRYFNPIGAHPSHEIGENPKGIPTNLLPFILRVVEGKIDKLEVFGDDYDTPDGTCIRDYIHVMDVAEAHFAAARYLHERNLVNETSDMYTAEPIFETVNVGTGYGKSVAEMIAIVENVVDTEVPHVVVGRRSGDTPVSLANPLKAKKLFNREAKRTIMQAVEDARNYLQITKKISE